MKNKDLIKIEYANERDYGMGSDIRDDFHTMSELYYNRMILFSVICGLVNEKNTENVYAWRSKEHSEEDGPMFDGFFIVGIKTPEGNYAYHYQLEYWDHFDQCVTLDNAPKYDGHLSSDIGRLYSLIK